MSRLSSLFEACRSQGRSALIGYLPTGFPDVPTSISAMTALIESGCDLVEVGVPYSDPGMDGPTIAAATEAALHGGVRVRDTLAAVEAISNAGGRAVVMTYWNLVERYSGGRPTRGADSFARDLVSAGGLGLITPDLIPDEADDWLAASDEHGLDRVFRVAPSSTEARIAATVAACRGFVYATSVIGVTGARDTTSQAAPALVARVRQAVAMANPGLPVGVVREGGEEVARAEPPRVDAVDGTAAGDAFTGCLLVGLLEGRTREEALRRACAAGAIAASRFGAQPSLPTVAEIDAILAA